MEQIKIIWTDLALGSMDEIGAYIEQNFSTAIAQLSRTYINNIMNDGQALTAGHRMAAVDFVRGGKVNLTPPMT